MAEVAAAPIGLSWAPKLPSLSAASGSGNSKKGSAPASSVCAQDSLWKPSSELVDGLFVPPRDPRKVNKLARKSVKDTTGKGWWVAPLLIGYNYPVDFLDGCAYDSSLRFFRFDMPAPTITPELKKDLEILQVRY